jgi:hypothetical protein
MRPNFGSPHEVHNPGFVRSGCIPAILPELGLDPALGRFAPQLQAQLSINPPRLLLFDPPALATQQHVREPTAVPNAGLAALLDALFEVGLRAPFFDWTSRSGIETSCVPLVLANCVLR